MKKSEIDRDLFNRISKKYIGKDTKMVSRIPRKNQLFFALSPILKNKKNLGRLLEIGCGFGFPAMHLKGYYFEYIGLDYSDEMIKNAKAYHKFSNIKFIREDINSDCLIELIGGKVDNILSIGVLHHLEDPLRSLEKLKKVLNDDGNIICIEPNNKNAFIQILRSIRKKIDKSYSPDQVTFNEEILLKLFKESGFYNVQIDFEGYLSAPFAQVILRPSFLFAPISWLCSKIDNILSYILPRYFKQYSWNIIVIAS